MAESTKSIGIDLGTTFSCVAVCRDDGKAVDTCPNDFGSKTTPSFVCFTNTDRLIGQAARDQSIKYINGTIFNTKRLIGRSYWDKDIQDEFEFWPFGVIQEYLRLKIQIKVNEQKVSYYPEEISGMILSKMKDYAQDFIGNKTKIDGAVITVPAYFNNAQREATKCAGSLANLKVMRIINEPSAAAFAFGLIKNDSKERHLVVFDLGGGTFDVSILKIYNTEIKILGTTGDNRLGGEDFDNNLLNHLVNDFKRKNKIDLKSEKNDRARRALRRLKYSSESTKINLSSAVETQIQLDTLYDNLDYSSLITRARFVSLNNQLFEQCIQKVDNCISDAKLDINTDELEFVLVGGSTRIPKIRELLKLKFPNNKIHHNINPDEAVAQGAAIFADILSKESKKGINDESLKDVTPLSLGVESNDGLMSFIITRNTEIPTKQTKTYSTMNDDQEIIKIKVYEGEEKLVEDNNLLGEFEIQNIPKRKKGVIKIIVTFTIDVNGILIVTAVETTTKNKQLLTICNKGSALKQEDINSIKNKMQNYTNKDDNRQKAKEAKKILIKYLENLKVQLNNNKNLTPDLINDFVQKCDETIQWAEFNECVSNERYDAKRNDIENEYYQLCNL